MLDRQRSNQSIVSSVVVILISVWLGLAFYSMLAHVSGLLTIHQYRAVILDGLVYGTLKIWLPWVVLSPVVVFLAHRFPVRPDNWVRRVSLHMIFLVGLSLLIGSVLSFHYHYREEMSEVMKTYLPWQHIGHFLFGDRFFLFNAIIYTVFVASFNMQEFYRLVEANELVSVRLRSRLNEARLRALRMQVNPHFLFNTLNAINVLVMKGENSKAEDMINRLGEFFRTTLEDTNGQLIPLATEISNVEKYLAIEQARFGERLTVTIDCSKRALNTQVPTMILQPLVENAVRHGVAERETACEIVIEAKVENNRVRILICDDGAGCGFAADPGHSGGIGIQNVRERLVQTYEDDFAFSVTGSVGEGVQVTIDIPAWTEAVKE